MQKARKLTMVWIAAAAALLGAGPAFADELNATEEPFVRGAQIYHPGERERYTGREAMPDLQSTGDESGVRTTFYDDPVAPLSSFAPKQLTLQRPWSEQEEALGVSH